MRTSTLVAVAWLLAGSAFAQPIPESDIRAAIAKGTADKGRSNAGLTIKEGNWAAPLFTARIYTPLAWIEQRAAQAAAMYQPMQYEDVTPELLEPVVYIVVPPRIRNLYDSLSIQAVVLKDAHKTIIKPIGQEPYTVDAGNAMGATLSLTGLRLTFPLDTWKALTAQGRDFSVVIVDSDGFEHDIKVKKDQFAKLR